MQPPLIIALQEPGRYDHPVEGIRLVETHISWVILTGPYAYKIKKPLNLGFLDFSSLEQRHYYCRQELELNRRLAPQLYLEVIPIGGTPEQPRLNDRKGPAIEYALKMRQFPQGAELDQLLEQGRLKPGQLDPLAVTLARFHAGIEIAPPDSPWGEPETIQHAVMGNFDEIRPLLEEPAAQARLEALARWSQASCTRLQPLLKQRKAEGHIRNCHGDMHLANMALIDNEVVIFDCIEFNDAFRWIDTMSEVAFLTMDLERRGVAPLAYRLLNLYLEQTGDFEGLQLLRFYQVYYAMVRAKVALIRYNQAQGKAGEPHKQEYEAALKLAEHYIRPAQARLLITHGYSGSGKTSVSQPLLEQLGMIRLRSDVERKRLFGYGASGRTNSGLDQGIYSGSASAQTYDLLAKTAAMVIKAGYSVIVDATFLKRQQRQQFRALAEQLGVGFTLLHFHASEDQLRKWISKRQQENRDASEATLEVLDKQLQDAETLSAEEKRETISIDTEDEAASRRLIAEVVTLYGA